MTQSINNQGISYRAMWLLIAFFVILGGASAYLLTRLYITTSLLADTNLKAFTEETNYKKGLFEELFRQKINEFLEITEGRNFKAFYHSRAIGMTPEYGLTSLISQIKSDFLDRLKSTTEVVDRDFLEIAYFDFEDDKVLVGARKDSSSIEMDKPFFKAVETEMRESWNLSHVCKDSECKMYLYGPVLFNSAPKGIVAAELSIKSLLETVKSFETYGLSQTTWVIGREGSVIIGPDAVKGKNIQEIFGSPVSDLVQVTIRRPRSSVPELPRDRMLLLSRSLGVGDLYILKVAPEATFGKAPSLWAWVVLASTLIGGLGLMVVYVIRSFRIQTRMNHELQEAKKLLESRVQERTSELESTNQQMLRHIMERKQAQKDLYQHSQILASITDTILIVSKEKKIVYANSTACETYGDGTKESLIGRSCHEALKGLACPCSDCVIDNAISLSKPDKVVTTWLGKDGKELWVYNTAFPYYDDEGGLVGAIILSTDYSAQKEIENELNKAKQEAEAASQAKSDFLARMSHEIRTPMYGILGTLELVLDGELKPEQRDLLLTTKFSAEALQGILNDILDFSKIEARKIDLENKIFSPLSVVESILATIAVKAHEKGLELISDIKPDVPAALVGDPFRLRQILLNLVGNAVKFTEKGEVVISVFRRKYSEKKLFIEFIVSDTGIGIRPEKLGTVFDPFAQAEGFISRTFGGTGLGLAICSTLVEIMGGRIWAQSEAERGSSFHFSIPFGFTEELQPLEEIYCRESDSILALVVDDNRTNRRILVDSLTRWGLCPEECPDAERALEKISMANTDNRPYRLMLLDYQLPGMSGVDLLEKIQGEKGLKVILMTSSSEMNERKRAIELGAEGVILKPVKMADLKQSVWNALGWVSQKSSQGAETTAEIQNYEPQKTINKTLKVLLAEDNPVNQKLLSKVLERTGYTVHVVENGRLAVQAATDGDFDLVLMDIQMPVMDGLTATKLIRRNEERTGKHLPVFAMTAHAYQEAENMCRESGMDGYLTKPISGAKLTKILSKILARRTPPPENDWS